MTIIDLSNIIFRAYQSGDNEEETKPNAVSSSGSINLSSIKFRAKQTGGDE